MRIAAALFAALIEATAEADEVRAQVA